MFEGLGRLGQGVEFAGIHPGRYHEIAGPFGCGFDQIGGFDVHEALLGEVFAHGHCYLGAQQQVVLDRIAPDVEVAVTHPQVFAAVRFVLDGKGRQVAGVEHLEAFDHQFHFAGGIVRVFRGAFDDRTFGLYDVFPAQFFGGFQQSGSRLFVESQLGDAVAVAQVDEYHLSQVAQVLHPTCQGKIGFYGAKLVNLRGFLLKNAGYFRSGEPAPVFLRGQERFFKTQVEMEAEIAPITTIPQSISTAPTMRPASVTGYKSP